MAAGEITMKNNVLHPAARRGAVHYADRFGGNVVGSGRLGAFRRYWDHCRRKPVVQAGNAALPMVELRLRALGYWQTRRRFLRIR